MKEIINKLQELKDNQEFTAKITAAENTQEALEILKAYGIEATEEQLVQALAGTETAEGELSEEMLENVAGGGKIWDWIKKQFNKWFDNQAKKNTDALNNILAGL